MEEYEEIIAQKSSPEIAHNVVEAIARLSTTTYQEVYMHFDLLTEDVDDNKFVDCAVASNAEYIVTNDKDFKPLEEIEWPRIAIISINKFLEQIQ